MTSIRRPTHDLQLLKKHVAMGRWVATRKAFQTAAALQFDKTDISDCVLALTSKDFYKSMASETKKGSMQDVYKPTYVGEALYVKLELSDVAVVISFKLDESV